MSVLKIGIIGCGKIARVRHAPEYHENKNCAISAWYDFDGERARELAEQYGGAVYDSVEALLKSDLDAVSVCVANNDHAAVTIQALQAGCHVLCEKPMATSLEECLQMIAAADKAGKRLMIGHNQRFAKAHAEARRLIESGEIGRVLAFHTTFAHPGPEGWTGQKYSWFYDKSRAMFGALGDLGIHKTDLIHYLLGESIVDVSAMMGALDKTYPDGTPINVEDNALCLYRTESGALGQMHVSWTNYGEESNATKIYGTKGALRLYDDPEYSLVFEKRDGEIIRMKLDELTSNKKQTEGRRTGTGVIDAFVNAVLTQEPSIIDAKEALKAMRVVFAADEAAREKRVAYADHT